MHIPEFESSSFEKFRLNIFPQDKTRYEYWQRTAFSFDEWTILVKKAKELGIMIGCTPFSIEALKIIKKINFDFIKIGSAEAVNFITLVEEASKISKPLIISSGMSNYKDLKLSAKILKARDEFGAILHCVSQYPTPLNKVNFQRISNIKGMGVNSGVSDHTGDISSAMYLIAHGIEILEVHTVFDKRVIGPDTSSSLTLDELHSLTLFRDKVEIYETQQLKEDKKHIDNMKAIFGRSYFSKREIKKGTKITNEDLILLKPKKGIPESNKKLIIGKKANKNISSGSLIKLKDLS